MAETGGNVNAWIRMAVLVLLCCQNAGHALLTRYSRGVLGEVYSSIEVVLVSEVLKLFASAALALTDRSESDAVGNGVWKLLWLITHSAKIILLVVLYAITNILSYYALARVEAAVYTVLLQLKIFTTAAFAVILLGRNISSTKWRALGLLVLGCVLVASPAFNRPIDCSALLTFNNNSNHNNNNNNNNIDSDSNSNRNNLSTRQEDTAKTRNLLANEQSFGKDISAFVSSPSLIGYGHVDYTGQILMMQQQSSELEESVFMSPDYTSRYNLHSRQHELVDQAQLGDSDSTAKKEYTEGIFHVGNDGLKVVGASVFAVSAEDGRVKSRLGSLQELLTYAYFLLFRLSDTSTTNSSSSSSGSGSGTLSSSSNNMGSIINTYLSINSGVHSLLHSDELAVIEGQKRNKKGGDRFVATTANEANQYGEGGEMLKYNVRNIRGSRGTRRLAAAENTEPGSTTAKSSPSKPEKNQNNGTASSSSSSTAADAKILPAKNGVENDTISNLQKAAALKALSRQHQRYQHQEKQQQQQQQHGKTKVEPSAASPSTSSSTTTTAASATKTTTTSPKKPITAAPRIGAVPGSSPTPSAQKDNISNRFQKNGAVNPANPSRSSATSSPFPSLSTRTDTQTDTQTEAPISSLESLLGVIAVLLMVTISGYASIYFESMLKKTGEKITIWERNFQLAFYSAFLLVFMLIWEVQSATSEDGEMPKFEPFQGWTLNTVLIALVQAGGGLLVAATLKYADAILKTLATSGAIVISAVLGHFLLGGVLDIFISIGCVCTILAIFNYTLDTSPVPRATS